MNKFDRVTSILILLQTRNIITAQALAERFEVSIRTIYRDLRTLEAAGIPLYAEAGKGYSLLEGYTLPPVMFTEEEALSLLVGEKLIEKMSDDGTSTQFRNAVEKIKAVLNSEEKETLENLDERIMVAERLSSQVMMGESYFQQVMQAIDRGTVVEIDYHASYSGEVTRRRVEPLGIHFYSSYWHMIAYCQLRNDYRDFRLDRIEKMQRTTDRITKEHPSLKEYLDDMAKKQALTPVTVVFTEQAAKIARTQKYFYGFVKEEEVEGAVWMQFLSPSLYGIAHWLLVFVDQVEVIGPDELTDTMRELVSKLQKNYLD